MSRYYEAHNGRRGLFIIDQETNQDVTYITDLLNEQDNKIKELEEIIKSNSNNKWIKAQYELFKKDCSSLNAHLDQLKYQLTEKEGKLQKLKAQLEEQKNINKKLNLENQKLYEDLYCEPLGKTKELENKVIELQTKLNMKEHEPAFCKLADRECEYLGKVEELEKQLEKLELENKKLKQEIRNNYEK